MSIVNKEEFAEGMPSELSLFDLPPTQTAVSEIYTQEIRPISQLGGDGPIEFRISGQNSLDYLDLANSQLYVKLKVKKSRWFQSRSYRKGWADESILASIVFFNRSDASKQGHNHLQLQSIPCHDRNIAELWGRC